MYKNNKQSGFAHLVLIMVVAAVIVGVGLVGSNVVNNSKAMDLPVYEKSAGHSCGGHWLWTRIRYTAAYNMSTIRQIQAYFVDNASASVQYRWIQHSGSQDYPPKYSSTKKVTGNYTYWTPNAPVYINNSSTYPEYVKIQVRCNSGSWSSTFIKLTWPK